MPRPLMPLVHTQETIESANIIMARIINQRYTFNQLLKLSKHEVRQFHTSYLQYQANSHLSKKEMLFNIFTHTYAHHLDEWGNDLALVTNYIRRFILKIDPNNRGRNYAGNPLQASAAPAMLEPIEDF